MESLSQLFNLLIHKGNCGSNPVNTKAFMTVMSIVTTLWTIGLAYLVYSFWP